MARVLIAVVAFFAVVSCGGDDSDTSDVVRPFAEVQVDDFVFEADATNPERAIFHVTTTEPMICAIVWGETEELGRFNNSLAMSGTGITAHDVYLPGAEAGRTYYFRVQGSTADGALYQSELATFTIPDAPAATQSTQPDRGENLAAGATVVDVSSEFSAAYAASNAVDDDGMTEWSSAGDGDDAFIVVDLGGEMEIGAVEFITRSMLDGSAITETYSVSIDGGDPLGPFPAGTAAEPNTSDVAASGRLVRFDVAETTGGNVGAVEVRVLAPPS